MTTKRACLVVDSLVNYRKQKGEHEGELLVKWKDGRREWTNAKAAWRDAGAPMFNAALKQFKLTKEQLRFGLTKKQEKAIEEQRKKLLIFEEQNKKSKGDDQIGDMETNNVNDLVCKDNDAEKSSDLPNEDQFKSPDESKNLPFKAKDLPSESSYLPFENDADIDESSTLTKIICEVTKDHRLECLAEKTDPAWCKPNAMFHEAICQVCKNIFVHKILDPKKNIKPSVKRPMHVCMNKKLRCTYAICHACYDKGMKKLLADNKEKDEKKQDKKDGDNETLADAETCIDQKLEKNDSDMPSTNDNEQPANDNEQPEQNTITDSESHDNKHHESSNKKDETDNIEKHENDNIQPDKKIMK